MDLMYFLIVMRFLENGTLLVVMIIPSAEGHMNSAHKADFKPFKKLLIEPTWCPALFMIVTEYWARRGIIACFLDGPLVMYCIFFYLFEQVWRALHCEVQ